MKRKRRRVIQKMKHTTRDMYPNYFTFTLAQTANDSFEVGTLNLPTSRMGQVGNRARIMEFLWVEFTIRNPAVGLTSAYWIQMGTGIPPAQVLNESNSGIIAFIHAISSFTTSGKIKWVFPIKIDLQSQDGHGFLVATDTIWYSFDTVTTAAQTYMTGRVFYRFVDVPLIEYVGIVQSQQQQT